MKTTRRGFFSFISKVASALAPLPLVARDMGDFDFLDSPGFPAVPEASEAPPPKIPESTITTKKQYTGDIRYNTEKRIVEVYDGNKWFTVAST